MYLPGDGLTIRVVARRGQHDPDRLLARVARAEGHDVPKVAVRLRVQLVENDAGRLVAVLGIGLRGQHLHLGAAHRVVNGLCAVHDAAALHKRGRVLHHPLGGAEHDARVVAVRRHDIDLAVYLAVRVQVVHTQRGGQLALAVFLGDLDVQVLVPPDVQPCRVCLVLHHLAVELGHGVPLPVHEFEWRAV